ncbi:MAG: T9SS type A sorting domain-containing protein, partial [Bacteroidetes bacterium]|nr:T9SS type A sorting domain-containing protein [Bacteroidota bacterium]
LVLVSIVNMLSAQQSYELFNSSSEYFFLASISNTSGYQVNIKGLKPDSVKISGTDTVYYHYRILDHDTGNFNCTNIKHPSWLGTITKRRMNGDNIFFNAGHDTIVVKTQASVGNTWKWYSYSNGNYILATVISKQYGAIYDGSFDTVKTIALQTYNASNSPIANIHNGRTIRISKTHGLLKFHDIYYFPIDTSTYSRFNGKRLTYGDIYNYNVGDIFQNLQSHEQHPYIRTDVYTTYTILNKRFVGLDTVVYTRSVKKQTEVTDYTTNINPVTYTISPTVVDSVQYIHLRQRIIDQMPQQYTPNNPMCYDNPNYSYEMIAPYLNCYDLQMTLYPCAMAYIQNDSCLNAPSVSCPPPIYSSVFINGFGSYVRQFESGTSVNFTNEYLVYFVKNGITCGNEIITGINNPTYSGGMIISPNPATNELTVSCFSCHGKYEISIFDLNGRCLLKTNSAESTSINLQHFDEGVYYVEVKQADGQAIRQKMIKY